MDEPVGKYILVGICFVAASVASCNVAFNYLDNNAIVDMVSKGADPLDAQCAVKQQGVTCVARAAVKNK